jgi:hypothetical protein
MAGGNPDFIGNPAPGEPGSIENPIDTMAEFINSMDPFVDGGFMGPSTDSADNGQVGGGSEQAIGVQDDDSTQQQDGGIQQQGDGVGLQQQDTTNQQQDADTQQGGVGSQQTGGGGQQQGPTQAPVFATVPNIVGGFSANFPVVLSTDASPNNHIQLLFTTTDLLNAVDLAAIKIQAAAMAVLQSDGVITADDILEVQVVQTVVNRAGDRPQRRSTTTMVITLVMKDTVPLVATTAVAESIQTAAVSDSGFSFNVDGFDFVFSGIGQVVAGTAAASTITPTGASMGKMSKMGKTSKAGKGVPPAILDNEAAPQRSSAQVQNCNDSPSDFVDTDGDNCEAYAEKSFCNPDGSFGSMWNPTETFADYAPVKHYYPIFHSPDAGTACCVCGGGEKSTYYPRHAALQAAASTASSYLASTSDSAGSWWVPFGMVVGVVGAVFANRRVKRARHSATTSRGWSGPTEDSLLLTTSSLVTMVPTPYITSPSQAGGQAIMTPRRRSPKTGAPKVSRTGNIISI